MTTAYNRLWDYGGCQGQTGFTLIEVIVAMTMRIKLLMMRVMRVVKVRISRLL